MSQTLSEMAAEAGVQLGDTSTPMNTVLKNGINRRYQRILQKQSWPDVNRTLSITVAAGEISVGIPIKGAAVRSIYNMTIGCRVDHVTAEGMESVQGGTIGTAGRLRYYTNEGSRGAYRNATSADLAFYINSSNGSDVGEVRLTGFDRDDSVYGMTPFSATASLNGTTAISIYSVVGDIDGLTVESFTKGEDTVGNVYLLGTTLGQEFSVIGPKERAARYTWIEFDAAADTDTVLRVNCRLNPTGLVNDDDVPLLRDIEHILIEGAIGDGLRRHQQYQKAIAQENLFESLLNDYLNMRVEDSVPVTGSGTMHNYREQGYY